ncbi:MAG: hypothetical protein JW999_00715 [Methanotrichaceae archaeon]|nr:hypothetical protein [Methanotrichaceae archaeon]
MAATRIEHHLPRNRPLSDLGFSQDQVGKSAVEAAHSLRFKALDAGDVNPPKGTGACRLPTSPEDGAFDHVGHHACIWRDVYVAHDDHLQGVVDGPPATGFLRELAVEGQENAKKT